MPLRFANPASESYRYPLLIRHLLSGLDQHATQVIVSEGKAFTYAELADRIGRLGAALATSGVEQGTTVAVMNWDDHRYLECYFAVPMMGAVLQTVNVRLSPTQILYTLRQTGAEVLIYHPDFQKLVDSLAAELPALRLLICTAETGTARAYESLIATQESALEFEDFDENAIATTFHTTGTTGDPKAVAFSHRQLVLHTLAFATALANQPSGQGFSAADVYMPMTPMFHVHAWGLPYIATMLGVKQVYPSRYDPARLLALQKQHGVTFSHCVPTILQMLLQEVKGRTLDLRWTMVIGGSPLPPALSEQAAKFGITAIAGYGMSETGPVITLARTHAGDASEKACRAGFPIPLVCTRFERQGAAELELRAPWLTQSYEGNPEASEILWAGGWLHTQDIAERDPDGAIRIVDRLKDVIKTGGEWVSSAVLEACTLEHPLVADVAYIAVADVQWGERPVGFVVSRESSEEVTLETIRTHLAGYVDKGLLSRYALPDAIISVHALPRTSVGKIDKKALRRMLDKGEGQPAFST